MARYKVLGMRKGEMMPLKSFTSRDEAEAYVRIAQRSTKTGSLTIEDSRIAAKLAGGDQMTETAQVSIMREPQETMHVMAIANPGSMKMPYAGIAGLALIAAVASMAVIEGANTLLASLLSLR